MTPLCTSLLCRHDGHCPEAHHRKAHALDIVPSPKMDTSSLVAATCSCGLYRSSPGGPNTVTSAHKHHHNAKMEALAKGDVCPECPQELRELAAARAEIRRQS